MAKSGTITPAIRIISLSVAVLVHAVPLFCLLSPTSTPIELLQPTVTRVTLLPPPPPPPPPAPAPVPPEPVEPAPPPPPPPPPPLLQEKSPVAIPPPPPVEEKKAEPEPPPPPEKIEPPEPPEPPPPPKKIEQPKPPPPPKEIVPPKPEPKKVEPPEKPKPEPPPPEPVQEPPAEKPPAPTPPVEKAPAPAAVREPVPETPPPAPAQRADALSDGLPDERPAVRQAIQPVYPLSARRQGLEGSVTCLVLVSERGRAERVEVSRSSGHAVLDEAAVRAIRKARFIPAKKDGKKVASETRLTFLFRLDDLR